MCETCKAIDEKIQRYARLARAIHDEDMIEHFNAEIEKLEAEKAALHPKEIAA